MTVSFWIILLAVLSYGLLHSLLASKGAKELAQRTLGRQAERWYRLAYNFISAITLLPVLVLPVVLTDKELYSIPRPWVFLTLGIQALAIIALVIGLKQTGIMAFAGFRQLLLPELTTPPRLVTSGLYRYVRHPLYTAGLVLIWLMPTMTCNLLALNIGLTMYILMGAYFEERKLVEEFGEEYEQYRQQTAMLIPGFRPRHKTSTK